MSDASLERVIPLRDPSLPIHYLEQGFARARAVGRVVLNAPSGGMGTGFLAAPGVLATCHCVLPDEAAAKTATVQFDYVERRDGSLPPISEFELDPARLFVTDEELDITLVAVRPRSRTGEPLSARGFIPLSASGRRTADEPLNAIHHGNAEPLQLSFRDTRLVAMNDRFLLYSGELGRGSAGAPVLDDRWELVAVHHARMPLGGTPDDGAEWVSEGIRATAIAHLLRGSPLAAPLRESLEAEPGAGMPEEESRPASVRIAASVAPEDEHAHEPQAPPDRDLVFISYARADQANERWADRLLAQLQAVPELEVRAWHDSDIEAGSEWFADIREALARTRVAVLMVGPGFFGSRFIAQHELPPLLEASRQHDVRIIPLVTDYVAYELSALSKLQAFNDFQKPLESLPRYDQNRVLVDLVREVARVFREA